MLLRVAYLQAVRRSRGRAVCQSCARAMVRFLGPPTLVGKAARRTVGFGFLGSPNSFGKAAARLPGFSARSANPGARLRRAGRLKSAVPESRAHRRFGALEGGLLAGSPAVTGACSLPVLRTGDGQVFGTADFSRQSSPQDCRVWVSGTAEFIRQSSPQDCRVWVSGTAEFIRQSSRKAAGVQCTLSQPRRTAAPCWPTEVGGPRGPCS
ncbi:hypothetical protein SAMN05216217_10319 [Halopseudomonas yangmingensis]|uniref:Uncharacterized protein n=1 Tax=Halopseudomonas yangmingensis TaxID=1720063 RepID=A0A1I4PQ44_9GAMM|nr:hypothetical protein SAMN05216217_10319 [Halopseudomonas yangmingensis]